MEHIVRRVSDAIISAIENHMEDIGIRAVYKEPGNQCEILGDVFSMDAVARAAIEAMSDPTEAMIEAADPLSRVDAGQQGVQQGEIWRAMIAAALRD